jgi:glycosyltransferase involved in cell wall biosynthesis
MQAADNTPSYVLITPAYNEEANIEKTLLSVIAQTVKPTKWVVVSDGSTDRTNAIVEQHQQGHDWIELIRLPEHDDRNFASKVFAFNAGLSRVEQLEYAVIGCLDADLSFDADYIEFLLRKFSEYPRLGVAGTPFVENGYSSATDSFEGERHVAGGCQLFRRECFEDIGGYVANRAGGIDWIAVTTARMKGWETRSFPEKVFFHHRTLGTGGRSPLAALFDYGKKDYYLGNHPVWEFFRIFYRIMKRPYLMGGLSILAGYLYALLTRMERAVSPELMRFHRKEELDKLRLILTSLIQHRKVDKFHLTSS